MSGKVKNTSASRSLLGATAWFAFTGALITAIFCAWNPINSTTFRLMFLSSAFAAWVLLLLSLWKWRTARGAVLIVSGIAVAMPILPGRAPDPDRLRKTYVNQLARFENCPYLWGGEAASGIDCSGLPRKAYREALLLDGLRTLNGRLIRASILQWWFDTSAQALGESYRGETHALGINGTIKDIDPSGLLPGDLAVTDNGVHVVVYSGDGKWIQADPGIGKVATLAPDLSDNVWFGMPVSIHRWTLLMNR